MDDTLIANWNVAISDDDIVWHLGDFAYGDNKEDIAWYLKQLNGKINLVKGNHDKEENDWYRSVGFDEVYNYPVIIDGYIVLSHEPFDIIADNTIFGNIYGHIHNDERYKTITTHTACVSMDRWDFQPVELQDIYQRMKLCSLL
jgi:calcineurin-like phosphoesterase family protein